MLGVATKLTGECNILLFLCLDGDSESAPPGSLGSHGSYARSQATSQSVCRLVSWCAWAEAYSGQLRVSQVFGVELGGQELQISSSSLDSWPGRQEGAVSIS
ncbi:unnamed protein product [Pleuronectes platessa]|uniref:Uncharacterized protein n=1 Tax=Pleuronectes platessa TaxID=8262 RepID=A0A9N7V0L4_PLEPL|nr:unnamed protein product [Pleuronectes platessa]